jgi:hypothetical protein
VEEWPITMDNVISARMLQRRRNLMTGKLAEHQRWLRDDTFLRVLVIQEDTCERLGEIAAPSSPGYDISKGFQDIRPSHVSLPAVPFHHDH